MMNTRINNNQISFGNKQAIAKEVTNELSRLGNQVEVYKNIAENAGEKLKVLNKQADAPKLSWLSKKFAGILRKVGESQIVKDALEKNSISKLVGYGNVCKEAMGTTIYTIQALTNEDLPPDKRKFVGLYDLGVGLISTSLQFAVVYGLNDKLIKRIKGTLLKNKNSSRYALALEGVDLFVTSALQTIICKRIIAPAITTPIAGRLKNKGEAEAAKKEQPVDYSVPPELEIPSKGIKSEAAALKPTQNVFAMYKKVAEEPTQTA